MKNLKRIIFMLICLSLFLVSCKNEDNTKEMDKLTTTETEVEEVKENINIGIIKGFPSIGMANLMEENKEGTSKNEYDFVVGGAPDEINAKLISGELDIATIPTNMAATLYNKTEGEIQILAVNTLGVIKLVSTDEDIKTIDDIKGKEIQGSGKGAIPQYTFEYILNKKGIDPETDVNIVYYPGHEEVAGLLTADKAEIATIPEPTLSKVMMDNEKIHIVADLTEEWNKLEEDIVLSQGCVVVRKEFAEKNVKALENFLDEYENSCKLVHSDIEKTAKNCGEFDIVPEKIALKAIPESNQVFIKGKEMEDGLKPLFQILFEADSKSVGGKLPEDDFYFTK